MKLALAKDTTSQLIHIFVADSSSTTGAGLTGLAYDTASLSWYYYREGAGTGATQITPVAAGSLGTWESGGFFEIDATDMPGWYELGVPNAVLATGVKFAGMQLKGAANMAPVNIEIQLEPVPGNLISILGTALTETAGLIAAGFKKFFNIATPTGTVNSLPDVVPGQANGLPTLNANSNVNANVRRWEGYAVNSGSAGYPQVTLKPGTGAGELQISSGVVQSDARKINNDAAAAAALTATRIGYLDELGSTNLPADVDAILADTGTDGVVLKAAGLNADAVTKIIAAWAARTPADDEAAAGHASYAQIMALLGGAHKVTITDDGDNTATLKVYKADGSTQWGSNLGATTATSGDVVTGVEDTAV